MARRSKKNSKDETPTGTEPARAGLQVIVFGGDALDTAIPSNAAEVYPELQDILLSDDDLTFAARDPFSADYADACREEADLRRSRRVDEKIRADLLAKPFLMDRPEDGALRGAAAVWRSVRDQLHNESVQRIDRSNRAELLEFQRELEARKHVVDAVSAGIAVALRRLDQRLEDIGENSDAAGAVSE